jgi:hypothetical protein
MSRIVAAGELQLVGQFGLHQIELPLTDNGRDLAHGYPLLLSSERMAPMTSANGNQGRLLMLR